MSIHNNQPLSQAWSDYWADNISRSSACLPEAPVAVEEMIASIWGDFFASQAKQAVCVDLGTGGGAVLRKAVESKPVLRCIGIDYAAINPALAGPGFMLTQAKIEHLPFASASVDVIVSQFALEYAPLQTGVREMMRVLRPQGAFCLLCHHADGIIVEHNLTRQAAIQDMLKGSGLVSKAIQFARKKKHLEPTKMVALAKIHQSLATKHPEQPVVGEVTASLARILQTPGAVRSLLVLRKNLAMESRRISALAAAAIDQTKLIVMEQCMLEHGKALGVECLYVPGTSKPLAWKLTAA